ncbi:MAG: 2-amino-4-hydroxy-6-hydroxymethyldihydropteridine diphosphokinase [Lysobacterales bacterium]|jgi:2-amino-4-hydroxy-6-hydroxymethyldihydropteridine diphosphokinase
MNKVIIGLGSNIDPKENIEQARTHLKQNFTILAESTFIQTKPLGYINQDDFINGSIYLETELNQEEVRKQLKTIENELGRKRTEIKFGPRSIDLDIVIWNEDIVDNDFYDRDFLKNAVLELIPNLKY